MTPTERRTIPDLPPEVLAFAAEKGVTEYLPGLCDLLRRIYPRRKNRVVLDVDPELCDVRTILFEVDVGDMDVAQVIATHDAWTEGLVDRCPTTHIHAFGLDMVPRPMNPRKFLAQARRLAASNDRAVDTATRRTQALFVAM